MALVPGICRCMTSVSTAALSEGRLPWAWAKPIWTAGGMPRNLMNFLPDSSPPIWMKKSRATGSLLLWKAGQRLINRQTKKAAPKVGEHHYDLGNDLFCAMLDRRRVYTCGYWPNARNLDEAQEAKLDLVCRKLRLQPGQTVLDIGCGWGSFAKFAAEKYQVNVVGITISKEQVELGCDICSGLPVQIQFKDYRDVTGEYDHIVSLGMFEHVGVKNYRTYMQVVSDHLKPDGLFCLQTIGVNYLSATSMTPGLAATFFPITCCPPLPRSARPLKNFLSSKTGTASATTTTRLSWPGLKILMIIGNLCGRNTVIGSIGCGNIIS